LRLSKLVVLRILGVIDTLAVPNEYKSDRFVVYSQFLNFNYLELVID